MIEEELIEATQALTAATETLVQALAAFSEAADAMRPMANPRRTVSDPAFLFPAAAVRPTLLPTELRNNAGRYVLGQVGGFLANWMRCDLLDPHRTPAVNLDLAVARALDRVVEPAE